MGKKFVLIGWILWGIYKGSDNPQQRLIFKRKMAPLMKNSFSAGCLETYKPCKKRSEVTLINIKIDGIGL